MDWDLSAGSRSSFKERDQQIDHWSRRIPCTGVTAERFLETTNNGLKRSGALFRAFLAETLYDIGYKPTWADPDVWLRPAVKPDGFEYYEYTLCYIDDVLCLSHDPK